MARTPKSHPTLSRPASRRVSLACSASLLLLTACASQPSAEPPLIVRKPQPTALPQSVRKIELRSSKPTLQRGCVWSQNTERLLSDGTQKSSFCVESSTPIGG